MKKRFISLGLITLLMFVLAACSEKTSSNTEQTGANEKKTITYLGKEYSIPGKTDNIAIAGSFEAMEDALILGVEPAGAISVNGKFPEMFSGITASAKSTGEKMQPNMEAILQLKPDIILGSSKFKPEVSENLTKIAPTIPVSHIATNWEANLMLMGQLTGKEQQAEQILQQYKKDLTVAKEKIGEGLKNKKVVVVRIRKGDIMIYPQDVYLNPILYSELGFSVPKEIKAAKAQEVLSLEKFSELNPDYLFVQFSADENKNNPKALEELENNPIWKSINAVKNNKVFTNAIDPLAQGGTAWSKINFLKVAVEKLAVE